jgi:deoxyribonuclease-4
MKESLNLRPVGFHTSIAGGIYMALHRAKALGCSTLQIFSHNPRGWSVKEIPDEHIEEFKKLRNRFNIWPLYVHTSYLINLASHNHTVREKSIELLIKELEIADRIGADYLVLHPGSASKEGIITGRKKAISALRIISKKGRWKTGLLLENTAGERGDISSEIENIADIMKGVKGPLISGICIDTCHAFQAGYDLRSLKGVDEFVRKIEKYTGIDSVKLIHLNDSKREFNNGVDRHEHIGKGSIGKEGFRIILNHPALSHIPLILETPKKSEMDDRKNLRTVMGLIR